MLTIRQHGCLHVCDRISASQRFWFTAAETEGDLLSINNSSVSRSQFQQQKPAAGSHHEQHIIQNQENQQSSKRQGSVVTARTVRTRSEQVYWSEWSVRLRWSDINKTTSFTSSILPSFLFHLLLSSSTSFIPSLPLSSLLHFLLSFCTSSCPSPPPLFLPNPWTLTAAGGVSASPSGGCEQFNTTC